MDSEDWDAQYSDQDSFECIVGENIDKMENMQDDNEKILLLAENVFDKIKFYCDYHGLNMLNTPRDICVANLARLYL